MLPNVQATKFIVFDILEEGGKVIVIQEIEEKSCISVRGIFWGKSEKR